ncbi:MAG: MoaD/ThiS family protein [Acidimicrobiia bacterium]|nr:MoaD/ThiS family protein [Acidimicrobiia bacterium]
MATVRIPTPLRNICGGASEVAVDGSTVEEVLKNLEAAHPGMGERLFDDSGALRRFVNIYVGEEDVRFADGIATAVDDRDVVSIVPAVAGG